MARLTLCDEELAVLTELGLTMSESRVYLALIQIGPSRIGSISKATGVCREHLYKTMRLLEGKGLIEKGLGPISDYKAMSIDSGLSLLIEQKQCHVSELKKRINTILEENKKRSYPERQATNDLDKNSQFTIVHGKGAIIRKLRESLQKIQTNLNVVTTKERFSSAIFEFSPDYRKAMERGVKIRIVAEKHSPEKTAIAIVNSLAKNSNFEFKYCTRPKTIISIFDEKEAMVTISATADLEGTSSLWSNDSAFIDLAQNYFRNKWDNKWDNSQGIADSLEIMASTKAK